MFVFHSVIQDIIYSVVLDHVEGNVERVDADHTRIPSPKQNHIHLYIIIIVYNLLASRELLATHYKLCTINTRICCGKITSVSTSSVQL